MIRRQELNAGRLLVAGLGLVLVAMAAVAAGYFTRSHSRASTEPIVHQPTTETVRGVVQSLSGDSLTLLTDSGPVTLKIAPSTPVEAVQRTTLASIRPGDWVNAGGVPHAQTVFALTALVVIPAADLETGR